MVYCLHLNRGEPLLLPLEHDLTDFLSAGLAPNPQHKKSSYRPASAPEHAPEWRHQKRLLCLIWIGRFNISGFISRIIVFFRDSHSTLHLEFIPQDSPGRAMEFELHMYSHVLLRWACRVSWDKKISGSLTSQASQGSNTTPHLPCDILHKRDPKGGSGNPRCASCCRF